MSLDIAGLGAIFDFGGKVIDKIFPDKIAQEKERAAATLALAQLQQEGAMEELKVSMSAILAEAQSSDPWTSRARPSFMYVIYIMILAALPMGVLSAFRPEIAVQVAAGMQAWLAAVPDSLWTLFGVGYVGYSGFRSFEKSRGLTK
jgi:hypothetical protein